MPVNTSVLVWLVSVWPVLVLVLVPFSVTSCPAHCNPSAADAQFGRLIFGFAVTEALGIFSLLIALLLIFAI